MLAYLSKKIAIPSDISLATVSWHTKKGWIACGGEDGLLKILQLETQVSKNAKLKGLAAPSNLSMNQSLEGHNGTPLYVVTWNEVHDRLTSSDQNGMIIVWTLYKGLWYEEMINNRNKSTVRDMQWNRDGSKICIGYEDGAVIVGSVDGNRIWGKELKGMSLTHVQWSPDGKVILFGNSKGEIHIYDSHGTYNSKMTIHCLSNVTGLVKLAGVEWYNGEAGYVEPNCPCLAIVFDNGRAELRRHELDDNPIVVESNMTKVSCVKWNHRGSVLAFAGSQRFLDGKELCTVQFYNTFGHHLHTLKVPGRHLTAVTWEGSGLRVALAVGSFIYFANIRHDYQWGYFSDTLVYSFRKPDKLEHCVIFWNTLTGEKHAKSVKNLVAIASCKDFCVLLTRLEDDPGQHALLLCNALGTPVDTKYIEMEAKHVAISHTHIVAASDFALYVWHYRTTSRLATSKLTHVSSRRGEGGVEQLIHIDKHPIKDITPTLDFSMAKEGTKEPVCAICVSERRLAVTRVGGLLQVYNLPKVTLESVQTVGASCLAQRIHFNSNSMILSVIDANGILSLFDILRREKQPLERREVWDLKWSEDNPDLFALMEKTRMYIFRGLDPEEPVVSAGHICSFEAMEVRSVLLDEVMKDPENPVDDLVVNLDIKSLRDTRALLEKVSIQDAYQFIEDNPHPRLWRLLAESSLEKLELEMAEKAFVRSRDYRGIKFVKRLRKLDSELKQKAEVAAFFHKFDDSEQTYTQIDRRDLAIDLRMKLGDWFRVVQLLKGGGIGDDTQLTDAWNAMGDYYADRQKWKQAVSYYTQGKNQDKLAHCHYLLEDYAALEKLANGLPENHSLLPDLGRMFVTVGMSDQAVSAFLKANQVKDAIDACVELNQWNRAVELTKLHRVENIDSLLAKYATHLLQSGKILSAIELYRKGHRFVEAAQLLMKVAKEASVQLLSPIKLKKIYVLAGLLIEEYHAHTRAAQKKAKTELSSSGDKKGGIMSTLQDLLAEDYSSVAESALLDNSWRGAEAYHYFMLAQKQLYSGQVEASLKTAICLRDYDDILPVCDVYSLLAVSSCAAKAFGVCSKAFIKLESLEGSSRESYEALAIEIFLNHPPKDSIENIMECPSCGSIVRDWVSTCPSCDSRLPVCVATGQPLLDYQSWVCTTCKHRAYYDEVRGHSNCPLCHSPIASMLL